MRTFTHACRYPCRDMPNRCHGRCGRREGCAHTLVHLILRCPQLLCRLGLFSQTFGLFRYPLSFSVGRGGSALKTLRRCVQGRRVKQGGAGVQRRPCRCLVGGGITRERQDWLVAGHPGWGNGGGMRSSWPLVVGGLKVPSSKELDGMFIMAFGKKASTYAQDRLGVAQFKSLAGSLTGT